jgi:diguanylate cyclase (GGDEF)-like protein/PAS domain S-box-containing protein
MQLRALVVSMLLAAALSLGLSAPALALKPIVLDATQDRVEITTLGDLYESHSDSLQVETAAGADGTTDRVSVAATTAGTSPNWMVFALTNPTENAIERWITADRYTVAGSGAIWPDLDARRIENVTPTMGFAAERVKSERADVFRITIEPGQTITYVVELASDRFSRINLWKPLEYELKVRDRQLFNGIMLGLTGLLAIFLTSIFAANHKLIFPASALVAWCVLGNLCVDFGFFHKLFQLRPEDNAIYRAAAESALAASILIFTHTFLRLGTLPALIRMIITVWMVAQLSLIGLAVIDPRLAATFARLSFVVLGLAGSAVILLLALRGQDRAMSLVPPWVMFSVWLFGAAVVLTGRVSGDIAVSSMVAGLVLVLLLIGFVVTQFAFRTRDAGLTLAPTEAHLRSIAIDGAGAAVWEWNARRNAVKVSPIVEEILDLSPGQLSAKADEFITYLHPADRERFRLMLWSIQERAGGKIRTDLRLRHSDNSYRWFEIEAASVPQDEDRQVRCVGLIRDITDAKRSHERLLHDAVHDSLTGLPNRALLVDRIKTAAMRAKTDRSIRPTLFFIDIDKFKSVNTSFGLVVGDSLLLTVARRLQRHLTPQDTLARVGGDQFAILSLLDQDAQELASLAERVRRSLRSPLKMAGQDIVLTGSVGVAVFNGSDEADQDLLKDAEVAMYRAKRGGADRIEIFKPEMRSDREERLAIEAELRKAIEKNQLKFLYQPIYYLPTEELAGFEAIVRWEHPKEGLINPAAIVPVDAESDLVTKLGSHVLMRAARDASAWNKELARPDQPLFVSVNVSSRQMFRQVLVQEVRHIVGQNVVPKGALKLEIAEALVMENPEQAAEILEQLRAAGADLLLDEFGTGYSSLSYLGRLPFDTIKLQRELVQASGGRDGNGEGVVRSIVAMARELNKKVVAEGVEAEEDAAFLRSAGCEYAQGYYYGDPVPDRDVVQMLRRVRSSERRLKPRGMFRPKGKRRQDDTQITADVVPMAAAAAAPPIRNGAAGEKRPIGSATAGMSRPVPVPGGLLPDPRANGAGDRPGADVEHGPRGGRLRPAATGSNGDAAASARTPGRAAGPGGAPPPIPGGAARNGARPNGAGAQPMPPAGRANGPQSLPAGSAGQMAGAPANGAAANGSGNGLPSAPPPVQPMLNVPAEALPLAPSGLPPQQLGGPPPMPGVARPTASPAPLDMRQAQARPPTIPPPPGQRAGPVTGPPNGPPQVPVPPLAEPVWQPSQRSAPIPPPPGPGAPPQGGSPAGAPPPIPAAAFAPPPGQAPPSRLVPPPPVVAPVVAAPKPPPAPAPDFSKLPPAIAESLARLAGVETPRKN